MRWAIIGSSEIDTIEFHLEDSLRFLGHEVKIFDLFFAFGKGKQVHYWLRRFSENYDKMKALELANQILEYKPDIVIGVYRFIHPLTIDTIKKKSPSIIAIHINPDQLITLEQQQIIASKYDYYFTKDPFMQRFMRDMAGLNAHYLPEAFNPRFHVPPMWERKSLEEQEDTDILIFGSMYPYRARIIEQISRTQYKIRLYGTRALYFTPALQRLFRDQVILGKEKSQKIIGAKIVLNCFHFAEVESVNCKYFEIHGVGGFQLCDYKNTLDEYSPIKAIKYSYRSVLQAIELINYYLPLQEERHAMAEIQRKHFLDHHTYEHRLKRIMDIIKG